jgi:hypothetical protein
MGTPKIAIVGVDPDHRLAAARAFDDAPPEWSVAIFESSPASADVVVGCPDIDDRVDVRFDPFHPQRLIQEVADALSRKAAGRVIAVMAASGGVGVTSVALHLAAAFRPLTSCYLAIHSDPALKTRLNLPNEHPTWREVMSEESLMKAAISVAPGFRVLLAPDALSAEDLQNVLALCRSNYDRVVIDTSGGNGSVSALSDRGVVVASATRPSMHRTRQWLRDQQLHSVALIANRLGPGSELTRVKLQSIVGARILLELPCAPALRDREDEGKLHLSTWSRYWRRIRMLARAL